MKSKNEQMKRTLMDMVDTIHVEELEEFTEEVERVKDKMK